MLITRSKILRNPFDLFEDVCKGEGIFHCGGVIAHWQRVRQVDARGLSSSDYVRSYPVYTAANRPHYGRCPECAFDLVASLVKLPVRRRYAA